MPALLAPDPLLLDSAGSTNLASAVLEDYSTTPAWRIVPEEALGTPTPVLPAGLDLGGTAVPVEAHGHAVFQKIHVIPRRKDLGAVGSLQEFGIEVWNAFLKEARTLDSITVAGPGNVTVVDHLGQPAHYAATASEVYTIQVPGEGDAVIDSLITWIFLGLPSAGSTDSLVLGFRLTPITFEPNRRDDIVESFGYLTDVLEAFNGNEQRIQLRATPFGTLGLSFLFDDTRDAQEANAILYANQARPFGVPRWQFLTPLTSPAAADDLEVLCDTSWIPFEIGGLCMIWASSSEFEIHTIEDVQADRVVLSFALESSFAAGAKVIPVVIGRLSPEEVFAWESLSIGAQELVFSIDRFKP